MLLAGGACLLAAAVRRPARRHDADADRAWATRTRVDRRHDTGRPDAPRRAPGGRAHVAAVPAPDTLWADLGASGVRWTGTKFRGRGKHEGTIRLASGALVVRAGAVVGGAFVADLRTLAVTDIPPADSVPRRRLREHLLSPDFFDVARYPTAAFAVTAAEPAGARRYRAAGTLAMHGVTRPVAFLADVAAHPDSNAAGHRGGELRAAARVRLDRRQWGITYRGSALRNVLVDDDILLDLTLVARHGPPTAPPAPRARS